jgi:hypothetical protein
MITQTLYMHHLSRNGKKTGTASMYKSQSNSQDPFTWLAGLTFREVLLIKDDIESLRCKPEFILDDTITKKDLTNEVFPGIAKEIQYYLGDYHKNPGSATSPTCRQTSIDILKKYGVTFEDETGNFSKGGN